MRLNKFISNCGITSRRNADKWIAAGKVEVNGVVVTELGKIIDEKNDIVVANGKPCKPSHKHHYLVLNKPPDYLVSLKDPFERKTIVDLLKGVNARVYPVGRLDLDSSGVLLLTDDGELSFRLTHPSYQVKKLYSVLVHGLFKYVDLQHFSNGITLEDGHIAYANVDVLKRGKTYSTLSIELTEGRKREIKRMCKIIGYPVISIKRVKFDIITIKGLKRGHWRYLTDEEIRSLKKTVGL